MTYFKVLRYDGLHYDHQYVEGLNILAGKFNDDITDECGPGGLYFSDIKSIQKYYGYGDDICVVTLPKNDKDFRMIWTGDKYRANKIILGPRHSLDDLETYNKFGLKLPFVMDAIENQFLDLALDCANAGYPGYAEQKERIEFIHRAANGTLTKNQEIKRDYLIGNYAVKIAAKWCELSTIKFFIEHDLVDYWLHRELKKIAKTCNEICSDSVSIYNYLKAHPID